MIRPAFRRSRILASLWLGALLVAPVSAQRPGVCADESCDRLRAAMPGGDAWWVSIPGGTFTMGRASDDPWEGPEHLVHLSPYAIGKTEVTQGMYAVCVDAGACAAPMHDWGDPRRRDHPVTTVTHPQAQGFCRFVHGRLPTEAEWEFAARGDDGRVYPWGNEPDGQRPNAGQHGRDTAPVGTHPGDVSAFGLVDMAGNVGEWVSDNYAPYPSTEVTDPRGPRSSRSRVIRGNGFGGWEPSMWRVTWRHPFRPSGALTTLGFRCAKSLPRSR